MTIQGQSELTQQTDTQVGEYSQSSTLPSTSLLFKQNNELVHSLGKRSASAVSEDDDGVPSRRLAVSCGVDPLQTPMSSGDLVWSASSQQGVSPVSVDGGSSAGAQLSTFTGAREDESENKRVASLMCVPAFAECLATYDCCYFVKISS
jgi:hypothetical protein